MKRIFIAIKVIADPVLLKMMSDIRKGLSSERIKWVDPGNIHLTLAFLGDTEEKLIKPLAAMLKEKCTGFHEFEFVLAGTGIFRNFHDPRVIWAGIKSPGRLAELNDLISSGLKDEGFRVEERPFSPHLTLGRIKSVSDIQNLKSCLDKYSVSEFQKVSVREVVLYESILTHSGPVYKPLGAFPL